MKHKKILNKIMCLMLAMALVFGMSMTVMATESGTEVQAAATHKISVPNDDEHTYEVYQIFTGDVSNGVLSNIKWGQNGTGIQGALVEQAVLTELEGVTTGTDKEKLDVIKKYWKADSAVFKELTKGQSEEVSEGYYLIKDKDSTVTGDDAYTTYIVQVVGDVNITRKSGKPSVDKQVEDNEGGSSFDETADHAIGETFQFKLTATVPADVDLKTYTTYMLKFSDTMSDGVTFEQIDSVTYKIGTGNATAVPTDKYSSATPVANSDGGALTITITDLKALVGDSLGTDEITVEVLYSAHLNENAVVSKTNAENEAVNNNKVELEYSNNPNGDGNGTGKTEPDTVFVFTYESDHKKVDGSTTVKDPLKDVEFKLYKDQNATTEISLFYDSTKNVYRPALSGETSVEAMKSGEDGMFNIVGLDAGTYYLVETKEKPGYNKLENPVPITITATHLENESGVGANLTLTLTKTENKDYLEIENFGGATLPSTGGIGTRIFYILGGILVLGCGVVLITRKRVSK